MQINFKIPAKLVQASRSQSGTGMSRTPSRTPSSASSLSKPPPRAPPPPSGSGFKKAPPPPPPASSSSAPPPPYTPPAPVSASAAVVAKKAPPPPPPLKPKPKIAPKPQYVVALYDFTAQVSTRSILWHLLTCPAQADGDLSFQAGDRIEIVEKSASSEDWWTGKLNGQQGVFPGKRVAVASSHKSYICARELCPGILREII